MSEWRDMKAAPKDGTRIMLRVKRRKFTAEWRGGLLDENERPCGGWHAIEGNIPPCWTDDICWASNENEVPSALPDAWQPAPPEA